MIVSPIAIIIKTCCICESWSRDGIFGVIDESMLQEEKKILSILFILIVAINTHEKSSIDEQVTTKINGTWLYWNDDDVVNIKKYQLIDSLQ